MDAAERARAWHHAAQAAFCDVVEPWEYGTVLRATRYPAYWDFNVVRVEGRAPIGLDALIARADQALAGLAHRRLDFEPAEAGGHLRTALEARGWQAVKLVTMRFEGTVHPSADAEVREVPYEAVHRLRVAWHEEDFPGIDPARYLAAAREMAGARGARVLAVVRGGEPVGFAQLERAGDAAEITHVYVRRPDRGGGLGTALTRTAIAAGAGARDLWIVADDEDRPKHLYARLGFRPVWTQLQFTRLPAPSNGGSRPHTEREPPFDAAR